MIWLIGNKGMLGQDVKKLLKRKRLSYLASDKEVDIADYKLLKDDAGNRKVGRFDNYDTYTEEDIPISIGIYRRSKLAR